MTDGTGEIPARRVRALGAAIGCVTVFGLSIGLAAPLLSLLLDARGTNPALIGLNAGATFLGVMLGPLLTARALRGLDVRWFLLGCLALDIVMFLALYVFDSLGAWFALRIVLGLIGSSIFTASEIWINWLAEDATRGRVVGIYAAALGAGFGLGPLLLKIAGIGGWAPFIANAVIVAAAMIPLFAAGPAGTRPARERAAGPFSVARRAPFLLFAVAIFGLYETSALTLLPLWGVRIGLAPPSAAGMVSAIYLGGLGLQLPLGWLSDKRGRGTALLLCALVGLAGAALLPVLSASYAALFALLFVWGGLAGGIYPVALGMAGDRFRGPDLVGANAALVMAYGVGSLSGPFLGGAAMALWAIAGLPAFLAALFAVLLAVSLARSR